MSPKSSPTSMGTTAKSLEGGHQPPSDRILAKHSSSLPNWLYFLSFAPPVPPIWRDPAGFFTHPWVLYALAIPGAIVSGVALPAFDIVLGYWSQVIQNPDSEPSAITARGDEAGWIMAIIAAAFILGYAVMFVCFSMAGAKLGDLLREQYLAAILIQDQAFFDRIGPGEIVTRAGKDINLIRTGLGEKLGYLTWSLAIILACFVSAFVHAPKLAGVLFAIIPFTFLIFTVLGIWADSASQAADKLDGKASSLIEQILSSVRIVQAFNINDKLLLKLENEMLRPLRRLSQRKSAVKSLELAAAFGAGFLVYAVSFWYGGISISEGTEVGNVLTAFYNYVNLFFTFAGVVPHFLAASQAIHAIGSLRLQIERDPPIDVRDTSGLILAKDGSWESSFDLQNVTFAYPARPTHKALDDLTLHVQPGKFTALVGPSGSGKSTLASLLLRLYDPASATLLTDLDRRVIQNFQEEDKKRDKGKGDTEDDSKEKQAQAADDEILASDEKRVQGSGTIKYAGTDIRDYNLRWLRRQVAVVLQNPQLISGTVFDNVVVGLTGTELEYHAGLLESTEEGCQRKAVIDERVEDALRKAQAWDFVCGLPDGLQTQVSGGRTGVLSGGQVQRVALARALVSRPRVLLLDEATSAVSADAEADIQAALLREQQETGMTLIVIAHRLSTIVAADRIYVMVSGQARASGTYDELMSETFPDQTFRNMALVKQETYTGKDEKTGVKSAEQDAISGSSGQTIVPTPSRLSRISTRRRPIPSPPTAARPLPPRMTRVKEAFYNTRMLFLAGCILYVVGAASFIISAWLHGRGVASFSISPYSAMRSAANRWALYFFILTLGTFAIMIFASYGLEYSGERIVSDYRRESVRALLKQEVAYFEDTKHTAGDGKAGGKDGGGSAGGLTAAVAYHPSNVGSVIGLILGQVIVSAAAFIGTIILAFTLTWRLAVMVLPALALNTGAGYVNFLFQDKFDKQLNDDTEAQSSFVNESANSIQMLAALTREAETVRQFKRKFTDREMRTGWLVCSGVALGVSQGVLQLFGGLIFYWGAQQLARGLVSVANLYTIIEAVIVAVYICARIWTYTGDFARMNNSLFTIQASFLFLSSSSLYMADPQKWLQRESKLHKLPPASSSTSLVEQPVSGMKGDSASGITFNNVTLRYPSRPGIAALNSISLHMEPGKAYAFCGTSGAGKSSIMAVLERYYEISEGSVMLDGRDIRGMDVEELRGMMGYVSQEAVLFEDSVKWNLLAGALEPEKVTQADLEWACEQACILDFIKTLPEGFDTDLGLKGGQLSGGQRQRLCIARALLRRPKILLLDEATSALDGNSERHVQQALDNASQGRLTITVAHRLSTIRKADVIFVMEQGQVVEQGSHEELVELGGRYYELVQAQL